MIGELPGITFALASLVIAIAGCLQSTIGFGFALVSVPALALIDPTLVPVPVILLALLLTASSALRERHAVDWRGIVWVLVGRATGTVAGLVAVKLLDAQGLQVAIALIILAAVALMAIRGHGPRRTRPTEAVAGFASGSMHMIAAISGPPLALLFHADRGPTLRATLAAVFFLGSALTLTLRASAGEVAGPQIMAALYLAPALALGFWGSRFFIGRVEGAPLRLAVLVFAGVGGVALLVRALG